MSYPEKVLADDEQVVEHLHPHWITLVPATFWFIVIGFLLLCVLTFGPWISWRTTHYVFTTHRVLIRRGVLRHVGRDISLQRINDVAFSQSLWDRIVKAGTITIESAGEHGQETLSYIPKSDQVQQILNRLIEQDSERRARQAYGGGAQNPPAGGYPQTQPYPPQP